MKKRKSNSGAVARRSPEEQLEHYGEPLQRHQFPYQYPPQMAPQPQQIYQCANYFPQPNFAHPPVSAPVYNYFVNNGGSEKKTEK